MALHYKKDGSLDMRYSSSRAAVSGGGGGGGFGGGGGSAYSSPYSSTCYGSSSASSNLHYKKDGSLDMRYSSSKAAVAQSASPSSGYGGSALQSSSYSSSCSSPSYGTAPSNDLHYKKDGSLDMRYRSSKEAVAQSASPSSGYGASASQSSSYRSSCSSPSYGTAPSNDLHYKKDGSLDMRYASSKSAALSGITSGVNAMGLKNQNTSGTRPKKSEIQDKHCHAFGKGSAAFVDIPAYVPRKKDGTPDMRTKEAKEWVKQQANLYAGSDDLPKWVPTKKDGTVDSKTATGRMFLEANPVGQSTAVTWKRQEYWNKRALDELFVALLRSERMEPQPIPPPANVFYDVSIPSQRTVCDPAKDSIGNLSAQGSFSSTVSVPENIQKIDYSELQFEGKVFGKGAFGTVEKATYNGIEVAVKKLHLTQLTRKEQADFEKEIRIHAAVGKHQNLVCLHGYCTKPPCIVMELVELGSLAHLLHYNDDPAFEAKMTDGRVKRNLVCGTAEGMFQLHVAKIVHGDLKPQNVLVTKNFEAKVTDFGLSTLRGKTSSSVRSMDAADDEAVPFVAGGTSGYMAPEILDSTSPPDFPVDVYSFGILLNEVVSEEEPYSDQYGNFAGRGPFGAANYARLGKRPTINDSMTTPPVKDLIVKCWSPNPAVRPTFEKIIAAIRDPRFIIPNSVNV